MFFGWLTEYARMRGDECSMGETVRAAQTYSTRRAGANESVTTRHWKCHR